LDPIYGLIGSLDDTEDEYIPDTPYGVTVDLIEGTRLTLHYSKAPAILTSLGDSLSLDFMWEDALKYWTAGQALRSDLTVQNREFGAEELKLYDRELKTIQDLAARDHVTIQHHQSTYRGLG